MDISAHTLFESKQNDLVMEFQNKPVRTPSLKSIGLFEFDYDMVKAEIDICFINSTIFEFMLFEFVIIFLRNYVHFANFFAC